MAESMAKIASHQLGRAAFAVIALSIKKTSLQISFDTEALEPDIKDIRHQIPEGMESFVPFCKRMAAALTENADMQLVLSIIENFCLITIQLSAAGRRYVDISGKYILSYFLDLKCKQENITYYLYFTGISQCMWSWRITTSI